jgi:hypothetical protein
MRGYWLGGGSAPVAVQRSIATSSAFIAQR